MKKKKQIVVNIDKLVDGKINIKSKKTGKKSQEKVMQDILKVLSK